MKEITIEGVLYLPATALAKEFRYTTDYIGQLCRSKKVDAQLVGRSWYVNPISLKAHKKNKIKKVSKTKEVDDSELEHKIKISRLDVVRPKLAEDVDREIPLKIRANETVGRSSNYIKRLNWEPAKYEDDDEELLPTVRKQKITPQKIEIDLAESTDLAIESTTKSTYMVAETLPEVSLKGKLKISNLEDYFDEEESSVTDTGPEFSVDAISELEATRNRLQAVKNRRSVAKTQRISLIPTQESRKMDSERMASEEVVIEVHSPSRFIFFSSTSILVALVLGLLFSESILKADSVSYQNEIQFSKPSAAALVSLFSEESY